MTASGSELRGIAGREAISRSYDKIADQYDDLTGSGVRTQRFRVIEAPLFRLAGRAGSLLEVGCGTGRVLGGTCAPWRLGVDISPGMLRKARSRGLAVAVADAHRLPFPDATFDTVLAPRGVFPHLDYGLAFAECFRVLAPRGRLGIHQYGARPWIPRRPFTPAEPDSSLHLNEAEELLVPAAAAGFIVVKLHFFRSVRFFPYAVPVPGRWWAQGLGTLWNHVVAILSRPG